MRVTFYHRLESDKVKGRWVCYGNHTSLGVRAKEGITVAAPPQIAFHTPVQIPALQGIVGDGNFTVQDRGHLGQNQIDVYIEARNKRDARRRMRELSGLPPWMEVIL